MVLQLYSRVRCKRGMFEIDQLRTGTGRVCPLCGQHSNNYQRNQCSTRGDASKTTKSLGERGKKSDGEPGEELRTAYVTRAVQQLQHILHSGVKAAALVMDACSRQFRK
jgi:hypothetical protein